MSAAPWFVVLGASTLVAVGGAMWSLREKHRRRQVVADGLTMLGIVGYIVALVLLLRGEGR